MGKLLLGFVILVAILLLGALIAGQVARHNLAKRFPPPGTMLKLQGHSLHVRCAGQGPASKFGTPIKLVAAIQ